MTRHLLHAAPIILFGTILSALFAHFGWLDRFDWLHFDVLNVVATTRDPDHVVIVGIDPDDYRNPALFGGASPLRCESVKRIVDVIAAGGPTAIGVDLDTSAPSFGCLDGNHGWPRVIWAADATRDDASGTFTPAPILGRPHGSAIDSGVAMFPQDFDGVVRRYRPVFPGPNRSLLASFPRAVAGSRDDADEEPVRLDFARDRVAFRPLSAGRLLAAAPDPSMPDERDVWRTRGPLTGKIVVLGGFYPEARDMLQTPVGEVSGATVMALAIENELHGGGVRFVDERLAIAVDIVVGVLLTIVGYRLRGRPIAFAGFVVGSFLVCLACSGLVFSSVRYWFSFAPVVASVLLHEGVEEFRHASFF